MEIHIEEISKNPKLDFKIEFHYRNIWVYVYSFKAKREMMALIPDKIDRGDYEIRNFGKLSGHAFEKSRTTKRFKIRRELVMK